MPHPYRSQILDHNIHAKQRDRLECRLVKVPSRDADEKHQIVVYDPALEPPPHEEVRACHRSLQN